MFYSHFSLSPKGMEPMEEEAKEDGERVPRPQSQGAQELQEDGAAKEIEEGARELRREEIVEEESKGDGERVPQEDGAERKVEKGARELRRESSKKEGEKEARELRGETSQSKRSIKAVSQGAPHRKRPKTHHEQRCPYPRCHERTVHVKWHVYSHLPAPQRQSLAA